MVYKNFVVHPSVMNAHLAGCAADKQQRFQEFMMVFWEKGFNQRERNPTSMSDESILAMAAELQLDIARFKSDMKSDACAADVKGDMDELGRFGVNGTPAFFINGKSRGWSGPERFKAMIDEELKAAESSGVPAAEYYTKVVMAGEKKFLSRIDAEKRGDKAP